MPFETVIPVQTLHEKGGRKLAKCQLDDGTIVYGVLENDVVKFLGTKAEAKKFYGNWRKL